LKIEKMERTIISFDYAIKDILRDKANFDILSGFLTELLCKPVSVQEILESEGNQGKRSGKTNRWDLKAKIADGELAVFEIQYHDQMDFIGKVLFNACKAVVEQIPRGKPYDVKKVYSINIAYDEIGADKEYVFVASLTEFKGTHFNETIPFSQNLTKDVRTDIHPEYFLILPYKFDEEIRTKFDEWVYVLKKSSVKSDFTAAGVQAAGEKLDVLKMTPKQRAKYERETREEMDKKTQLLTAELKGVKKGRAEAEIEIAQERKKAEIEIAQERQKAHAEKIQNAKKMLQKGLSIEDICDFTGLTPQQISELT
jgi:predicted transposase/invertase (TIGR01784 family)